MATESAVPTGKLSVERFIHTSREKVFEAWTNPKSVTQWMRPKGVTAVEAQMDARVGGSLRLVTKSAEGAVECIGEYRVVEPPSRLAFTWTSIETDDAPTLITVALSEDELEPGCQLTLTHEGFVTPEALQRFGAAWETMLAKLALFEKTKRKRGRKMAHAPRSR